MASIHDLLARARRRENEPVHVVIETGAMYWVRLLHAAGAHVHVVDGKQARRFAESLSSSGAKDDARDAQTLALLGRSREHQTVLWEPPSEAQESLQMLSRTLIRHAESLTKLQQRLRSLLRELMPNVEQALPGLTRIWVLEFLTQMPTPFHFSEIEPTGFDDIFHSRRVHQKTRAALRAAMQEDLLVSKTRGDIAAIEIRGLVTEIRGLIHSQTQLEKLLEVQLEQQSDAATILAIPGIGPKLCAAIMAVETGTERDQLAIQMGASPVFKGSGTNRRGQPKGQARMRRSAHASDRRMVYILGRMITQHTRWGKAMYQDAQARHQPAATIYRRIARSMMRIITALRKSGESYDESLYIERLKRNGVAWAMALS